MSFGKAKRFNYKDPDLTVSPADYYICTSLEKSCTISKYPRFPTKDEESSSACNRCRRYSNESTSNATTIPIRSSTPNLKMRSNDIVSTELEKIKNRIFNLNQQDIQRHSLRTPPRKSMEPTYRVKDLVNRYEDSNRSSVDPRNDTRSLPNDARRLSTISRGQQNFQNNTNGLNFWTSDEFIDDDYHSYTSSDDIDIDLLNNIDYSRIEESIRKAEERKTFENIVIKQMNKMSKRMDEFNNNLKELHKKLDSKTIRNQEAGDIKQLIFTTIENLRKEFEERKQFIVSHMIEKLKNLAEQLYTENIDSTEDFKITCRKAARELYKNITQATDNKDGIDIDCSYDSEDIIEHETTLGHREKECLNYKNIYQFLSEQLQGSRTELQDLKKEQLDITFKWGSTQKKIETQTSMIQSLEEEIKELKKSC